MYSDIFNIHYARPYYHSFECSREWSFFYFNSESNESTYDRPESYRSQVGGDHTAIEDKPNGGFEKHMDEEETGGDP